MNFLSERNLEMHKEYLNNLMLKYAIFEKSYPALRDADVKAIPKLKIKESEKREAIALLSEILAHKLYFSSFGKPNSKNEEIRKGFGSEAGLLYSLFCEINKYDGGMLFLYRDGKNLSYTVTRDYSSIFLSRSPLLALDICEHAYFYDYGFDRRSYVLNSLSHLDLTRI